MRQGDLYAVILAIMSGLLASSATPGGAAHGQRTDREGPERLLVRVEQAIGKDPRDCGSQHRTRYPLEPNRDSETIDLKTLERALACARESAAKRRPFVTYVSEYGFDSWLASGLMGTRQGRIIRFSFDNLGAGRLQQEACARPRINRSASGWLSFACD